MWSNFGVGFQDRKVLLRAPVSGGGLLGCRGSLMRDHRLDEDHLRLLDHRLNHLHCGTKTPGLQSRRIISRLKRQQSKTFRALKGNSSLRNIHESRKTKVENATLWANKTRTKT